MTRYIDRSRIIQYQRCPRSRWWQYEYQGKGIVPKALSIPLTTGTHVHAGSDPLLRNAMDGKDLDIEAAVKIGLDGYWRDVTTRGFDLEENEIAADVAKEQASLTEALIRLMGMKVVPWLLEDGYKILAVEQECEWEIAPSLVMMGRPDAVMLHKPTGEIHLLSLKTKKNWDSRADKANSHDDQGISEAVCWEASHGARLVEKVAAVVMPTLLKGNRKQNKKTKQYTQSCPLIRGWRQENRGQTRYAHSYQWDDEFGQKKLAMNGGSKWESFNTWDEPGGVKAWMEQLATGTVQPEAGDPLAQSVMIPTPYYRQEADIKNWKQQVKFQEVRINETNFQTRGTNGAYHELDWAYPQYRHSCHYPGDCSYLDLCYGPPQMAEDPLATERFMWRIPHHKSELVQIEEAE